MGLAPMAAINGWVKEDRIDKFLSYWDYSRVLDLNKKPRCDPVRKFVGFVIQTISSILLG